MSYSNGKSKEVDISSFKLTKDLHWIHGYNATLKDLHTLQDKTKIPLYDLKHVLDMHERSRIENKSKYSLLIFRGLVTDAGNKRVTSPIEFIFSKNFVITLTLEDNKNISKVFEEADLNYWKAVSKADFGPLVYNIFKALLRDYSDYLEEVDEDVNTLEDVAYRARDKDMQELHILKREIMFLRKSLSNNKDVFLSLNEGKVSFLKQNDMFHELIVEMDQLVGTGEMIRDRITGVTDIYFTAVSNKLNEVMKSFAVIASLLLIPMLVSGIYGMNIVLPFQQHPRAFVIVIGIMVASVAAMIAFFKNKGWV